MNTNDQTQAQPVSPLAEALLNQAGKGSSSGKDVFAPTNNSSLENMTYDAQRRQGDGLSQAERDEQNLERIRQANAQATEMFNDDPDAMLEQATFEQEMLRHRSLIAEADMTLAATMQAQQVGLHAFEQDRQPTSSASMRLWLKLIGRSLTNSSTEPLPTWRNAG